MTSTEPIAQIDPSTASDLAGSGALLLDVREGLPITTGNGAAGTVC